MENLFTLKGKKILVTGASSGIGKSIAVESSRQGAQLVIVARNAEKLDFTKELLDKNNENHFVYSCDLTSTASLDLLVESLEPLDGLVLNAGSVKLAPISF